MSVLIRLVLNKRMTRSQTILKCTVQTVKVASVFKFPLFEQSQNVELDKGAASEVDYSVFWWHTSATRRENIYERSQSLAMSRLKLTVWAGTQKAVVVAMVGTSFCLSSALDSCTEMTICLRLQFVN